MNDSSSVVYASFSEVVNNSPLAQLESDRLTQVKRILDAGAKQAEENSDVLPQDKVIQARRADAQLLNAKWITEQQGARQVVLAEVRRAADALLKKEGYSLIIDSDAILAAQPNKDVSGALAAALKDVKPDFGSLPVVTTVKKDKAK